MHIRAAFEEGACGAVAFAWTDEWWRGGFEVEDWAFGLVDRAAPAEAGGGGRRATPSPTRRSRRRARQTWPRVSVVVCAYNAADTLEDCLSSLERLDLSRLRGHRRQRRLARRTGEIAPAASLACAWSKSRTAA